MKHLLLFFLLLAGLPGMAQSPPVALSPSPPVRVYPGNPYSLTGAVTGSTSLSAVAYYGPGDRPLPAQDQPVTSVVSSTLTISWNAVQTARLPIGRFWLEVRTAGIITQAGFLPVNRDIAPLPAGSPVSLNISVLTVNDVVSRIAPVKNRLDSLIATGFDVSGKVDKQTGYRLGSSAEFAKILANETAIATLNSRTSNLDNTSDVNKPVSIAQQAALNAKYNANNPAGYTTEPTLVASFAIAKTLITTGVAKSFTIANYEPWGVPTHSRYDGTNWTHSPAILNNN